MKKPRPKARDVAQPAAGGQAEEAKGPPIELLVKDGYVLGKEAKHPPVELPVWPGRVIGSLTREEIYEDVD